MTGSRFGHHKWRLPFHSSSEAPIPNPAVGVRKPLLAACLLVLMACPLDALAEDRAAAPPPFITRGMPADGQEAMQPLAGDFTVKMSLFGAMGPPRRS
jgi:hypothetical protein